MWKKRVDDSDTESNHRRLDEGEKKRKVKSRSPVLV